MFLRDEPGTSSENQAQMPELLDEYKTGRVRLVAQARELDRLRQQVRASAEREAAAIVTNARRNVRQVLLDARHELLVLVAQLQAVGCEATAEDAEKYVVEGEAAATPTLPAAPHDEATPPPFGSSEIVNGARRDVREVLMEAQTELIALAGEARELRARIARQHAALPEAAAPEHEVEPPMAFVPAEPPAAAVQDSPVPAEAEAEFAQIAYTPLSSDRRVWFVVAAALIFAAMGLTFFLGPRRPSAVSARGPSNGAAAQPQASSKPATEVAPPPAQPVAAASVPVSSGLAVTIDVRRPVWIRTTVDGRADVGREFDAGETRTLKAREEVVMRAGNAGAVFVSVNGSEPRALGADGQVITRRFGRPPPAAPPGPAPLQAAATRTESAAGVAQESTTSDVGTTGTQSPSAPPAGTLAEREVARATQRWFEAYFAGDTAVMNDIAAPDFSMLEQRTGSERLPATMRGVDRSLQKVQIEVAGDGAVMSATLTERVTLEGRPREYVCLVSGVWIRTEGRWRLKEVRFIDPFRVGGHF
jgi:ketosteroid isomerase-like protein